MSDVTYRYCPKCGTRFGVTEEDGRTRFYDEMFDHRPLRRCSGCGYLLANPLADSPPRLTLADMLQIIELGICADICDGCYEDRCDAYECECVCHIQTYRRKENARKALTRLQEIFGTAARMLPFRMEETA